MNDIQGKTGIYRRVTKSESKRAKQRDRSASEVMCITSNITYENTLSTNKLRNNVFLHVSGVVQ